MPLILIDLDNTLIDRAAAFRRWARDFVSTQGAPASDVEWLVATDRDGYESREMVARALRLRYDLSTKSETETLEELRLGLVDNMTLEPSVADALQTARLTLDPP